MTAPTVRSVFTASATGSGPLTLNKPSGAVVGDGLVAFVGTMSRSSGGTDPLPSTINAPAGWSLVTVIDGKGTLFAGQYPKGPAVGVYLRILGSGETSWQWSTASSINAQGLFGIVAAVKDLSASGLVDAFTSDYQNVSDPVVAGPVSAANDNSLILWILARGGSYDGSALFGTPSGTTKLGEVYTSSGIGALFSQALATHGSSGTKSFSRPAGFAQPTINPTDWIAIAIYGPAPPAPTAVTPNTAGTAGGTTATLSGSNFTGQTSATLGGNAVTNFTVVDDHTVTFTVPAHAAGATDLVIGGVTLTGAVTYVAPTVTAISPAFGAIGGADFVTIIGTGFGSGATATVGGNALTSVTVVDATRITGYTAAHAVGVVDVVVTSGDAATLSNGFTFVDVADNIVKLVKGGAIGGTDRSASAHWGAAGAYQAFGGAADLWGNSLTPADVNATDFGVAISAIVASGSQARIDHIRMTTYYSMPGVNDPSSFVSVLHIDSTKTIAQGWIYKLPRAGLTIANDPNIEGAQSDAEFFTSRLFEPSRAVVKTFRQFECWLDMSPETNTPGLQVWASVDGGSYFQLLDADGTAMTARAGGATAFYFPTTAASVGHDVRLRFTIPATVGGEVAVAVKIRDGVLRGSVRPKKTELLTGTLILGVGEFEDGTSIRNTIARQRALLEALDGPNAAPTPYRDPTTGEEGYMALVGLTFGEALFRGEEEPTQVAHVQVRRTLYE